MNTSLTAAQTEPHETATQQQKKQPFGWLGETAAILSLVGLVLSLSGYGVALSAENKFGMPHATLFTSAFDLLDLSGRALMNVLTGAVETLQNPEFYFQLAIGTVPLLLGIILLWTIIVGIGSYLANRPGHFLCRVLAASGTPDRASHTLLIADHRSPVSQRFAIP